MAGESSEDSAAVRVATPRDLDALVALSLTCARTQRSWAAADWSPPDVVGERRLWWERLRDGRTWVGVAEAGPTRVGCVSLWPARHGGSEPHLGYMAGPLVDPEWWGEGVGSRLHDEALAVLSRLRYRHTEVAVEAGNGRARRFLEDRGWERTDSQPTRSPMELLTYARAVPKPRFSRGRKRVSAAG